MRDTPYQVISQTQQGPGLFRLVLTGGGMDEVKPGQFVMLSVPSERFYFRRPFSVADMPEKGQISVFYKVFAEGTQRLAGLQPGDRVDVLGPLGNGFPVPESLEHTLLLAGGIGVAPMICALQAWHGKKALPRLVYGARNQQELGEWPRALFETTYATTPERLGWVTDDGSHGHKGYVHQWLENQQAVGWLHDLKDAYICGPTPMMAASVNALTQLAPQARIWVSLEEHMPCGMGACTGCVVSVKNEPLPVKTCVAGPVFDGRLLNWGSPLLDVTAGVCQPAGEPVREACA